MYSARSRSFSIPFLPFVSIPLDLEKFEMYIEEQIEEALLNKRKGGAEEREDGLERSSSENET